MYGVEKAPAAAAQLKQDVRRVLRTSALFPVVLVDRCAEHDEHRVVSVDQPLSGIWWELPAVRAETIAASLRVTFYYAAASRTSMPPPIDIPNRWHSALLVRRTTV
jgi:hypothetical protein